MAKHAASGFGDPYQFGGGAVAVDEHGDRFGDDHVEGRLGEVEVEDVAVRHGDQGGEVGTPDVGLGSFQHHRRDVDRGDMRPVSAGDLDGGGCDPASNVEHAAGVGDACSCQQGFSRGPAARVDHPLADHGHELVRIQSCDLLGCQLGHGVPSDVRYRPSSAFPL